MPFIRKCSAIPLYGVFISARRFIISSGKYQLLHNLPISSGVYLILSVSGPSRSRVPGLTLLLKSRSTGSYTCLKASKLLLTMLVILLVFQTGTVYLMSPRQLSSTMLAQSRARVMVSGLPLRILPIRLSSPTPSPLLQLSLTAADSYAGCGWSRMLKQTGLCSLPAKVSRFHLLRSVRKVYSDTMAYFMVVLCTEVWLKCTGNTHLPSISRYGTPRYRGSPEQSPGLLLSICWWKADTLRTTMMRSTVLWTGCLVCGKMAEPQPMVVRACPRAAWGK